jgi:hypothetical protein
MRPPRLPVNNRHSLESNILRNQPVLISACFTWRYARRPPSPLDRFRQILRLHARNPFKSVVHRCPSEDQFPQPANQYITVTSSDDKDSYVEPVLAAMTKVESQMSELTSRISSLLRRDIRDPEIAALRARRHA